MVTEYINSAYSTFDLFATLVEHGGRFSFMIFGSQAPCIYCNCGPTFAGRQLCMWTSFYEVFAVLGLKYLRMFAFFTLQHPNIMNGTSS